MRLLWAGLLDLVHFSPCDSVLVFTVNVQDALLNTYLFLLYLYIEIEATKRPFSFQVRKTSGVQDGHLWCSLKGPDNDLSYSSGAWEVQGSITGLHNISPNLIRYRSTDGTFVIESEEIFIHSRFAGYMYGPRTFLNSVLHFQSQCAVIRSCLLLPTVLFSVLEEYMNVWESL